MRPLIIMILLLLSFLPLHAAPEWLDGTSEQFPARDYITGVGIGDSLDSARSAARAEIAKTFAVRVTQRAHAAQAEQRTGNQRRTRVRSELSVGTRTTVTTDELLQGVSIAGTWHDATKNQHYALAILDRRVARRDLARRMLEQETIFAESQARATAGAAVIPQLRAIRAALSALAMQEILATRLQAIDPSTEPALSDAAVRADLESRRDALSAQVHCTIEADDIPGLRSRLEAATTSLGISVVPAFTDNQEPARVELTLRATITVMPAQRSNPRWKFSNWESSVVLVDSSAGHAVIAAVVKNGQTAQVTEEAARIKALADAVRAAADAAEQAVNTYIYGR